MQLYEKIYRRMLFALLGITKIISSTDRSIPGKWHNVFDSVKVSSQVLHTQLSYVDEEVAEEFHEMERDLNRRMGKGKLYSREDIEEAREIVEQIDFNNIGRY